MTAALIVGYDPGGSRAHGIAVLRVERDGDQWRPRELRVTTGSSLGDAVDRLNEMCGDGRIVAAGVDTLTEWSSGPSGWRPADLWLRKTYPAVRNSIVAPNSIYGSMAVNGAAFLTLLGPRFREQGTMVTEAHPKVCFHALTGRLPAWSTDRAEMGAWALDQLGIGPVDELQDEDDHRFDAVLGVLAALRGLNGQWTRDLHALGGPDHPGRVQFCGPTHYWWPG